MHDYLPKIYHIPSYIYFDYLILNSLNLQQLKYILSQTNNYLHNQLFIDLNNMDIFF